MNFYWTKNLKNYLEVLALFLLLMVLKLLALQ